MNINEVITKITPLYNSYRKTNKNISGTQSLEIMWDIGEILRDAIEKNKTVPHTLFREIYGNAEGSKNITKKSYITREFQSRCYRIRKIFDNKEEIKLLFPNLKKFRLFSQAMPFFDNEKYKLEGVEKNELIKLLNSENSYKYIIEKIYLLQQKKIGIKNPRTQRLGDLESERQVFIEFYNYIFNLIKTNDYTNVMSKLNESNIDKNDILLLARNTHALSQDGLKFYELNCLDNNSIWVKYNVLIKKLVSQKDPKQRRRFRRIIPPNRIVRMADFLYALTSAEAFNNLSQNMKSKI